jgi:hypothetical protein
MAARPEQIDVVDGDPVVRRASGPVNRGPSGMLVTANVRRQRSSTVRSSRPGSAAAIAASGDAPLRRRHADHGDIGDSRMGEEDVFDISRVDAHVVNMPPSTGRTAPVI